MDENQKIPGEKIALIEEYLPGENTFEDDDAIRATTIGSVNLDSNEKIASINKQTKITVPKVGDIIIVSPKYPPISITNDPIKSLQNILIETFLTAAKIR